MKFIGYSAGGHTFLFLCSPLLNSHGYVLEEASFWGLPIGIRHVLIPQIFTRFFMKMFPSLEENGFFSNACLCSVSNSVGLSQLRFRIVRWSLCYLHSCVSALVEGRGWCGDPARVCSGMVTQRHEAQPGMPSLFTLHHSWEVILFIWKRKFKLSCCHWSEVFPLGPWAFQCFLPL